ncbi:MAG: Branched-chain alpha-keto acid dehydrogenase, E1 component, alpha subunit / Branched-chain alpha-keto acid dehydrogenase, E1 component, beta subunit [uncultured Cytophagales bacterium]|uniref:3-methyl-2-oxobutanoate dehydrogenase (2-methylpropanoyl-transferring) n=1 Tax=uncultured Cytophagales bacterium TaxID=158755 RepID=A0A6J4KJ72_9SPHI|nr:MAG: Branched-chain alpha-keto acid dehydrogenase, E1 component, alpha subunit / Branched-chain alpha-keto acid dehydrogenase, E1 component, beta subunit [uncultured Cytophagales bacterium]
MSTSSIINTYTTLTNDTLKRAYHLMCVTREMDRLYDQRKDLYGKYPHSTSRGHEAVQIAAGLQLHPYDFAAPYYRDEALLLAMGVPLRSLMLQMLAKGDDPFSGGRNGYGNPVLHSEELPKVPYLGLTAGSHVVPATGVAQGLAYLSTQNLRSDFDRPVVFCSLGDGALTSGEVAEALQVALLKRLPIVYLVQDNDWARSARADEYRGMDPYEFAGGIKGMRRTRVNGADFVQAYESIQLAIDYVRIERLPIFLHAKCPLIGSFRSDLPAGRYRTAENLALHGKDDPIIRLRKYLTIEGETEEVLERIDEEARALVAEELRLATEAADPDPGTVSRHTFAEAGETAAPATGSAASPGEPLSPARAATAALNDLLGTHREALYYGQDVGGALGGLYGEAHGLAERYGAERVFNMPAQPAYLVGAALGMAVTGCRPIAQVTAEGLWGGLGQLVHGLSRSNYLSNGQFPAPVVLRVPVGAPGGGGPFGSGSIESVLLRIPGLKVAYPSGAADLAGLLKAAFADPNPFVVLEHRGLYGSTAPDPSAGTADATPLPLGKARVVAEASAEKREEGGSVVVVTYGMGVHWARAAAEGLEGAVEILDLRTLHPLDWEAVTAAVGRHNKALVLTEEAAPGSFAEALAGRIARECFKVLDGPVGVCGAEAVPAIPQHERLEAAVLPNPEKVTAAIRALLNY